jgi:predicted ArsR family transcriptional regulator
MDLNTTPGDSLNQPTRARLFALLTELRRSASTDELAERLNLHPNGVRVHLDRLQEAGLVTRTRERQARGRPRDQWSISPSARPGGDRPTAYADLGRWLARAIDTGEKHDLPGVEATGRQIGRELAPVGSSAPAEEQLHEALAALGFQPTRERGGSGKLTFRLTNCPYREAVRDRPQVVCGLHRGLTRGLLDVMDPEAELAGFVPKDPEEAGCLIEVRRRLASEPSDRER